ncbi:hypothetical protein IWZ00DRAFT_567647 [Phyllosticta capitalensis]
MGPPPPDEIQEYPQMWKKAIEEYFEAASLDYKDEEFKQQFEAELRKCAKTCEPAKASGAGSSFWAIATKSFAPATVITSVTNLLLSAGKEYHDLLHSFDQIRKKCRNFFDRLDRHGQFEINRDGRYAPHLKEIEFELLCSHIKICGFVMRYAKDPEHYAKIAGEEIELPKDGQEPNYRRSKGKWCFGKFSSKKKHEPLATSFEKRPNKTKLFLKILAGSNEVNDELNKIKELETQLTAGMVDDTHMDVTKIRNGQDQLIADSLERRDLSTIKRGLNVRESHLSVQDVHSKLGIQAVEGMGDWIVGHELFKQWKDSSGSSSQPVLKLQGPEKCGKTFLCRRIISHLMNDESLFDGGFSNRPLLDSTPMTTSIAYYYFGNQGNDKTEETSIQDAITSVIWQLVQNDIIHRRFIANHCGSNGHQTQKNNLWKLLQPKEHSNFFVLFDGINHSAEKTAETLSEFLSSLNLEAGGHPRVRVLLSGTESSLECISDCAMEIDLAVSEDVPHDIELFVDHMLYKEVHQLQNLPRQYPRPNSQNQLFNGLNSSEFFKSVVMPTGMRNYDLIEYLLGKVNKGVWSGNRLRELAERLSTGGKFALVEYQIEHANKVLDPDQIEDLNEIIPWVVLYHDFWPDLQLVNEVLSLSHGGSTLTIPIQDYVSNFNGLLKLETFNSGTVTANQLSGFFRERFNITRKATVPAGSLRSRSQTTHTGNNLHPSEILMTKNLLLTVCGDQLFKKIGFDQFFKDKEEPQQEGIQFDPISGHIKIISIYLKAACDMERDYKYLCMFAAIYLPWHLSEIRPDMLSEPQISAMADVMPLLVQFLSSSVVLDRWFTSGLFNNARRTWLSAQTDKDFISRWFEDSRIAKDHLVQTFREAATSESDSGGYLMQLATFAAWIWLQKPKVGTEHDSIRVLYSEKAFHWIESFLVGSERCEESMSAPRSSISSIEHAERWAKQALKAKSLDMTIWNARVAEIFQKFNHFSEAVKRYELVISSSHQLTLISEVAVKYADCLKNTDGDCARAIQTLRPVLEQYTHRLDEVADHEKPALLCMLAAMCDVYHKSGNSSKAVRLCQDALKLSPQNTRFTSRMAQWMFESGQYSEMASTLASLSSGNLVRLLGHQNVEFLHRVAISATQDQSNQLVEACRKALQDYGTLDFFAVNLAHCYALILNWSTPSSNSHEEALRLWQRILRVPLPTNDEDFRRFRNQQYAAGSHLAASYFQAALGRGRKRIPEKEIEAHFGLRRRLTEYDVFYAEEDVFLARFRHLKNRTHHEARHILKEKIAIGIALLSDQDIENDFIGFEMLSKVLTCLDHDEHAISAWSLRYRSWGVGITSGIPQSCSGFCGIQWDYRLKSDIYKCKDCFDVQFDKNCWTKVQEGALGWNQCGKDHNFIRIPKWNDAAEERFKNRRVLVGDRDLDIDEWMKELRTWLSPKLSSPGTYNDDQKNSCIGVSDGSMNSTRQMFA